MTNTRKKQELIKRINEKIESLQQQLNDLNMENKDLHHQFSGGTSQDSIMELDRINQSFIDEEIQLLDWLFNMDEEDENNITPKFADDNNILDIRNLESYDGTNINHSNF